MARPDTSIDPRIMDSAREEFRTLGVEQASLKSICQRAGVTTGALYKRYAGKEELFRAVVADTVADLDAVYEERTAVPASALSDEDLFRAWFMDEDYMLWWFRFLNERRDGFVLLLTGAEGTAYANFQHDWVEVLTKATSACLAEAHRRGICRTDVGSEELHVLLSASCGPVCLLDHHLRALYPRLHLAGDPAPLHFGLPSL